MGRFYRLQAGLMGELLMLEALVERTLARLLHDFPGIRQATLRICKPQAFDDCAAVCIEQSLSR